MHIIHIIDSLAIGGAQKLLITFGHEAKRLEIKTEFICLGSKLDSPVEKDLENLGFNIVYFPAAKLFDLSRIRKMIGYLRTTSPDVIQTHLLYANIMGGIAGYINKIPVIATLHGAGLYEKKSSMRIWLEEKIIDRLNRGVIAVGNKTAEIHQKRFKRKKISVIPNAVNASPNLSFSEKNDLRQTIIGGKSKTILIAVGRHISHKAYDDLIYAFAELYSHNTQTVLLLIGSGNQTAELKALAQSLNLVESILFLGDRNDIPRLLAVSDIYVSSSITEGMPLAVMEAMMAGLPIVATSVGDLPNIFNEDYGRLVPPHQPHTLAKAVGEIIQDKEKMKKMGLNAQQYALKNFSSSAWINKLIGLYKDVLLIKE